VRIGTADLRTQPDTFHIRIDSRIPVGSGFGSSAALAVAVVAACRRACGDDVDSEEVARLASSIEQHQHGRTSGIDVQAVLRGGVMICRRRDEVSVEREDSPGAGERLAAFRLFHSGTPNETTGETVGAVRRLRDREPGKARDAFAAIEAATLEGRDAMLRGDDQAYVPIVRRAEAALEALGVVPVELHAAIRGIEAAGGAAKISGAGALTGARAGLVLVVHPDALWHERFVPPTGWVAHRVGLGVQGLRKEIAA
jgi:mevalonate kinase